MSVALARTFVEARVTVEANPAAARVLSYRAQTKSGTGPGCGRIRTSSGRRLDLHPFVAAPD